jgi:hypothetical protein
MVSWDVMFEENLASRKSHGVEERKNQSIINSVKAMIHDHALLMFLWEEACNRIVYLQNMNPHRILGDKTPKEALTGVKPKM